MDIGTKARLNDGKEMPMLGFGTWQLKDGKEATAAVLKALETGYRHIDTAAIYGNEESIGKAVMESNIPRDEIFITTKIWNDAHNDPMKAFNESLKRLRMDYVDLYLIHWPVNERNETWQAMEEILQHGKARSIGVSNFTIRHLEELMGQSEIVPAVNQVEFSPFLYQKDLLDFCKSSKIQLEAYSPLSRAKKLDDPRLKSIAQKYNKSPAQIMLRWSIQHSVVVIPKSRHPDRIKENADIFDFSISPADMKSLDSLNDNFRTCWDPSKME